VRLRGLRWSQPPPFNHTESERFRGLYCFLHALQPTPESVRRGSVWIGDLVGVRDKPSAAFLDGCRKLLRDSYPIRIEDVPVVRCPPVWSGAFVGTYPYWSRHFGAKFVRVDAETLRRHFPSALLGKKTRKENGNDNNNSSSTNNKNNRPLHRRKAHRNKDRNTTQKSAVASNGDQYNNSWENLDDDNDHDDGFDDDDDEHDHSDWTSVGEDYTEAESAIGTRHSNDELLTKLERLVRIRFETERTFRLV